MHVHAHELPLHDAVAKAGGAHTWHDGPHALTVSSTHAAGDPQRCCPFVHSHAPVTQCSPPWQATPHPPQLSSSVCASTHVVASAGAAGHAVRPAAQSTVQPAGTHAAVPVPLPLVGSEQTFPHAPQLLALEVVSTHEPLHRVGVLAGQPLTHE